MSDPTMTWWEAAKDAAKLIGTVVAMAIMRLLFGSALKGIEKRLSALNGLDAIRADIADLKKDVENLKRPVEPPK